MVTEQKDKNKRLITKQNKIKIETEKVLKNIQDAQKAEKAPEPRVADYQSDLQAEFKKMISGNSNVRGLDGKDQGKGGMAIAPAK